MAVLTSETCWAWDNEIIKQATSSWSIFTQASAYIRIPLDVLISQIYFWNKTLHVSDSSSVHHQEFFTVDTAMVYVIQVLLTACSWSCSQALSKPLWHIPLLCVEWKTPDGGQRNCPKHVEFYSKNKFKKLVHLVGFSIRKYHDARSPERQRPRRFNACNTKFWSRVGKESNSHLAWDFPIWRFQRDFAIRK